MKKPTGRREIAELFSWLSLMIKKISNKKGKRNLRTYFNDL